MTSLRPLMTPLCDKLELLVDGDLPPEEAEEVRLHIPDCERCQQEMADLMQLQVLGRSYFKQADVYGQSWIAAFFSRIRSSRPQFLVVGALAASLVVIGAVTLLMRSTHSSQHDVWLAERPERLLEARVSHPDADRYRPLTARLMGGVSASEELPLTALAALEQSDPHGLAAAYLVRGDPELTTQALAKLKKLGHSPDLDSDRAAAMLLRASHYKDEPELVLQAFRLTQAVLAESPRHPQALWNRALALRELKLRLAAARGFREGASLTKDGWSEEADQKAKELQRLENERHARWKAVLEAGKSLVGAAPDAVPEGFARSPVARKFFYDAVRAAPGRGRVLALLPIAQSLDERAGGSVLGDYVRRIAEADFERRGPLAKRYADLLQNRLSATDKESLLSDLLHSKEDDILLGALVQLGATSRHLERYETNAAATRDPWFHLLAAEERAKADVVAGRWTRALQTLLAARELCTGDGLEYRCLVLESELSSLYLKLHQLSDARAHAERGWSAAREHNEWGLERSLLWNLAQIARLSNEMSLARAYLEEFLEHEQDTPDMVRRVHQELAVMAMQELRVDEARQEIDLALATRVPLGLPGAFALADIARLKGGSRDEDLLTEALEAAKTTLSPGEHIVATHVLGRYFVERDVERGRSLLWRSIEEAEQPGLVEDQAARRARAYSFTSLLHEAGRRHAFEEVLELFERERRRELPRTCLLAATADSERTLFVARGVTGDLAGVYDEVRRSPLPERLDGVVPEALVAVLRQCERVEVLARPPLHGRAGLLPPDVAWSYLTRASAPQAPRSGPKVHLVVSDVELPRGLHLDRLAVWTPIFGPEEQRVILSGAQATPSRVLEEMKNATEIDLGVHGVINDFSNDSYLLLASKQDGRDGPELSVPEVRAASLKGAPFVVLAACHAAHPAYVLDAPFNLPAAFIEAGARGVLAATVEIPDQEAMAFFDAVRARMRSGTSPALALRDERALWLGEGRGVSWLGSVLLFE